LALSACSGCDYNQHLALTAACRSRARHARLQNHGPTLDIPQAKNVENMYKTLLAKMPRTFVKENKPS
jgi:hypothetical protein